jgi:hypothetical protein
MDEKVLLSLLGVGVGWLLAQLTSLGKDWWKSRKLTKGLLTELQDIDDQLARVILTHQRQIQVSAHMGIEPATSLPLQNAFFRHYYKDAFEYLNREQRISYQLIHAALDELNRQTGGLARFLEDFFRDRALDRRNVSMTLRHPGASI